MTAIIDIIARLNAQQAGPEAQKLTKDITGIGVAAKAGDEQLLNLGATLNTGLRAGLGVAERGVGLLAAGLGASVQAAKEAEVVQGQLAAVIESTGGAAGLTADEVNHLATEQERLNAIDGDFILTAQSMLLTFTNISESVFPAASQAALDMATTMTQGNVTAEALKNQAIGLGKALNDFDGFTALKRQGVSFSEEQERQVAGFKAVNDLISYQELVLGELAVQFGGAAAANAATLTGRIRALEIEGGRFAETVGNAMVPNLVEAAENALPGLQAAAEAAAPAVEKLAGWIGEVAVNVSEIGHLQAYKDEIYDTATAHLKAAESGAQMVEIFSRLDEESRGTAGGLLVTKDTWRDLAAQVAANVNTYEEYREVVQSVARTYEFSTVSTYEQFRAEKSLADQTAILTDAEEMHEIKLMRAAAAMTVMESETTDTTAAIIAYNQATAESTAILSGYEPRLEEVEGMVEEYRLSVLEAKAADEEWATTVSTEVAGALGNQMSLLGNLFTAYDELATAEGLRPAWARDTEATLTAKNDIAGYMGEITTGYKQMVLDIMIADAGGVFTQEAAEFAIGADIMTRAEAAVRTEMQNLVTVEFPQLLQYQRDGRLTAEELGVATDLLATSQATSAESAMLQASETGILAGKLGEAYTQTTNLKDQLLELPEEVNVNVNYGVHTSYTQTGEPPPGLGGGAVGGQGAGGGATGNPGTGDDFATGGFTGFGPVNEIAGYVHRQEYVFDAGAVGRIGRSNLEALHQGGVGGSVYNDYSDKSVSVAIYVTGGGPGLAREIGREVETVIHQYDRTKDGQNRMR